MFFISLSDTAFPPPIELNYNLQRFLSGFFFFLSLFYHFFSLLLLLLLSREDSHVTSVLCRNSPVGRAGEQPGTGAEPPPAGRWAEGMNHLRPGFHRCRTHHQRLSGSPAGLYTAPSRHTRERCRFPAPHGWSRSPGLGKGRAHGQARPVPAPRPRAATARLQVAIGTSSAARPAPPAPGSPVCAVPCSQNDLSHSLLSPPPRGCS